MPLHYVMRMASPTHVPATGWDFLYEQGLEPSTTREAYEIVYNWNILFFWLRLTCAS